MALAFQHYRPMYTQCPECKTQHSIDTELLRTTRGMLKCDKCGAMFDALEFISDTPIDQSMESKRVEFFPVEEATSGKHNALWTVGLVIGLMALAGQFFYFESYNLSQNPILRPWLVQACQTFSCSLPAYKNAEEISILQGSLEASGATSYRFKAIIVNQAGFSQPFPNIRLTLLNFTGEAFAERVFTADDYRPALPVLDADKSGEIILDIAAPARKIGGYSFKLL
ncbi:zinc-ribbon and DUF3426 domain-containing protein [Methylomarinum vadi]|uniref:zinc-ribbon and DUF3426 domain-containing protein n=1 Tax=Methylomarinum vadi TaxID=438855 RepID=UPI0013642DB2|nr:zinc-ribbon and DUF3426 domain-containing protein [Methylomarinum vadi]